MTSAMTNAMNRRSLWLWGSLVAAIAASIWAVATPVADSIDIDAPRTPSPLAMAGAAARDPVVDGRQGAQPNQQSMARAAIANAAPADAAIAAASERQTGPARDDIFAAYSWQPPKPATVEVKEPPRAPPLPFAFSGRLEAEGPTAYILSEGTRMHIVAVGEQVGDFRLQQASAGALVFLHVPTNLSATLSIAQ